MVAKVIYKERNEPWKCTIVSVSEGFRILSDSISHPEPDLSVKILFE